MDVRVGLWRKLSAEELMLLNCATPLDCEEIQPVHPKGDQSWVFIGGTHVEAETPILWPPNLKSWLIWKDPDAGKDWGQEEKGMTEDEMVGWHHWLDGHEFGWTPGVGDGQGGLACFGSWGRKELDTTERLNWTEYLCLLIYCLGCFSSKEQASFNFMAVVIICSDFGAQEYKVCHCFHCFPIYLSWSDPALWPMLFICSQPQLPFLYNGDTNVYLKSMKECMSAWSSIECVNQYRINKHSDHLLGTLVHLRHCAWPLLGIWKTQLCSPSSSSLSSYSIFPKLRIQWFCNFVFSLNKYLQSNSCVLGMVLYSEDKPPNKTD